MKKGILILAVIIGITSCKSFNTKKKPKVTLKGYNIEAITLTDMSFLFNINIFNPYPISLTIDKIEASVFIEDKKLVKINTKGGVKFKSKGKKISTIRVKTKYLDLLKLIKNYPKKDYADCKIKIVFSIPVCILRNIPLRYTVKTKIPIIRPKIRIKNFRIKKISLARQNEIKIKNELTNRIKKIIISAFTAGYINHLPVYSNIQSSEQIYSFKIKRKFKKAKKKGRRKIKKALKGDISFTLEFDVVVTNETKFKLLIKQIQYDFYLNNKKLMSAKTTKLKTIGNKTILRVSNRLNTKSFSKSTRKAIMRGKFKYKITGSALIKLPNKLKKVPLKLKFNKKGKI